MDFTFNPTEDIKDPLKQFGRNLTDEAVKGNLDPVIGRDEEIRRVIRILSRRTKNNPILIGEPGVGKTAIVEGLAQKIVQGNVPENLKDKDIIEIDLPQIIAGASFQGQFEKRLKSLMDAIKKSKGNIIVFIDEIHMLVGTGKNVQGSMDAAQILKPMLARGEMHLIGATTLDEHRKYIEQDPALERRMQKVLVDQPTEIETINILRGLKDRLETFHRVKIHDNALVSAVKLSSRYISDRFLPDKAIDLIDEAAAAIQTETNSKPEELEKVEEKIMLLEMEKASLSAEKDSKNKKRLEEIKVEIEENEKLMNSLKDQWKSEKEFLNKITMIKSEIEDLKMKQNRLQSEGEYEKASMILYKEIPDLEKKLESLEEKAKEKGNSLIKEDVTEAEIADIVSKWTGIPVNKLLETQKEKLLTLEKILEERVKGQKEPLKLITDAILRSRANINDPNKPIGSFLFMGPTGVGKTEVARALAYQLFDSEKNMIRLDMSEYMEKHSVSKIIGSPPGYVGYDQGGILSEAIRRKPYSIVLFDEIEKAHPDVVNILLQVLDEGRLTDNKGKVLDFKNTIIIMTTNIGALEILDGKDKDKTKLLLNKYFKPEFINRIDEIVVFDYLKPSVIEEITKKELDKLTSRLQEEEIFIEFDPSLIDKIVEEGYDPIYGARPIKRYITKNVESFLAKKIITQEIEKEKLYVLKVENNNLNIALKRLN